MSEVGAYGMKLGQAMKVDSASTFVTTGTLR